MLSDKKMKVDEDVYIEKKVDLSDKKIKEIQEGETTVLEKDKIKTHPYKKHKLEELKEKVEKEGVSKEILTELIDNLM